VGLGCGLRCGVGGCATADGSGVWDVPDGIVPYILGMADSGNGGPLEWRTPIELLRGGSNLSA